MLAPTNGNDDEGKGGCCCACDGCGPAAQVSKVVVGNGGGAVACRVA